MNKMGKTEGIFFSVHSSPGFDFFSSIEIFVLCSEKKWKTNAIKNIDILVLPGCHSEGRERAAKRKQ